MVFLLVGGVFADIIHVPGQYPTIQEGIDAANPGDIVMVAPGRYEEEITLKADVVVRGAGEGLSIIDGQDDEGDVVKAIGNSINEDTKLQGFTITGAISGGSMPGGGGVFCNSGAAPDISNCRVEGNDTGIACWNGSEAYIHNCVIIHNNYTGISTGAGATIVNNTIHDCRTGFNDYSGYRPVVMNNVITGNSAYGIVAPSSSNKPQLSYNDVWGNDSNYHRCTPGLGDISADPFYADTANGDYHLQAGSPCVDSGNPAPEYNDPDGTRNDMGAYGGPGSASSLPMVVLTSPARNELNVPDNTNVVAGFNMDMDSAGFTGSTFRVSGRFSGFHWGTVGYDSAAKTVTLDPDDDFRCGEPVTATLTEDIVSAQGDSLDGFTWQFTVSVEGGSGMLADGVAFDAGTGPNSLTDGDFDGDGDIDLAVVNEDIDSISVLLGNGDGTFGSPTPYHVGDNPHSICAGDFNSDSILDLGVAVGGIDSVAVLLGNGDGTFDTAEYVAVGDFPDALCCGDFDLDGDLDLATANAASGDVSVLLGNGDGTFGPAAGFPAGSGPRAVCTGDFDNDGSLDLAVANSDSDSVSVLPGNGDGTFGPATSHSAGGRPHSVCTGDFSEDGNVDLAVANLTANSVSVLIGDGNGGFGPRVNYAVGTGPRSVAAADLNGDGSLDLLSANESSGNVSLLFGDGSGGFGAAVNYPAAGGPNAAVAGDYDNDGDMDVCAAAYGIDSVVVLLNDNQLEVVSTVPAQYQLAAPESTDVSPEFNMALNPSTLDSASFLAYGAQTGLHFGAISYDSATFTAVLDPARGFACGEKVTALLTTDIEAGIGVGLRGFGWSFTTRILSASSGEFAPHNTYPTGSQPRGVWAADFDSDGDIDIATTCNSPASVAMLRNNGNGTFAAPVYTSVVSDPISLFGADLDSDGDIDLAVFHNQPGASHLEILKNDGSGSFTNAADYTPAILGQCVSGADFDADGDVDLVLSDGWGSQNNVRVMLNNGTGGFSGPHNYSAGSAARGCGTMDVDNDGDMDIVVANSSNRNVSVFLNDGSGAFPTMADYLIGESPNRLYANDFNADGWVDIATANYSAGNVAVILNDGDGTFGTPVAYPTRVNTRAIAGGDFDGDADVDLAMTSSGADTIAVLLGNGDGTFGDLALYQVGQTPWGIASADFNLDGAMGLACANYNTNNVSVLFATGLGIAGAHKPCVMPFLRLYPNPFRQQAGINCDIGPVPGMAEVRIYDASGRMVRELSLSPNRSFAVWDARDQSGRAVAPGVYFVQLEAGDLRLVEKAVLTR